MVTTGCNAFDNKKPVSQPLSFWTNQDILMYIKDRNLPIASVYGEIGTEQELSGQTCFIKTNCKLQTSGVARTGCMFCMFGVHLENEPNRFQNMKKTHPKLYKYCMEELKLNMVLDFIGVKY